jgi:GT2 family glycosyltransferase
MQLSVIILSYNVKDLLKKAIRAVYATCKGEKLQIIVVDNASSDGSSNMVKKNFPKVKIIESKTNTGFSKGNNLARKAATGDVVLFLNPDTEVGKNTIKKCLEILIKKKELGAVTCKVQLPNGNMDYSCHRGLPTVWNTLCYWLGLPKLFPSSSVFAGYEATYLDINKSHYIDCISGTFLMVKKEALNKINWWDEDYWWNGEDIEFCFRLKKAGYKIWYEPSVTMMHYKGSSSGLWGTSKVKVSKAVKERSARSASRAMSIFVEKHWKELGPYPIMLVVRLGIFFLEKYRLFMISLGKSYK